MITKIFIAIIMLSMCVSASLARSEQSSPEIDIYIARYLGSLDYVSVFKQGIRSVYVKQGSSDQLLRMLLELPDDKIVIAVIPIFRDHLSLEGARAISEYYSSDSGKAITHQQMSDISNPNPQIRLTPKQISDYNKFIQSKAGEEVTSLNAFMQTDEFSDLIMSRLVDVIKSMRGSKGKQYGSNQKNTPDPKNVR